MNLKVLMVSLALILFAHIILQKMNDMENENFKLLQAVKSQKSPNKSENDSDNEYKDEDVSNEEEENQGYADETDMRQDLLNFVESSSFYEPVQSFGKNKILPEATSSSQNNQPGYLNISKDNEVNIQPMDSKQVTNDYPKRDNVTLKNSKYDKMSNSRIYYSTTANDKYRTIKSDQWKYDKDTITSGNVAIEGSLFAYDQNECHYAAL